MKEASRSRVVEVLIAIVILGAAALRIYGIAWDDGFLFHPDERQILMVADDLQFPTTEYQVLIGDRAFSVPWVPNVQALLTPQSSWNPGFFAYGSLPIYMLRIVADVAGLFDPDLAELQAIHYVARALSALFDLGTVYLLYLLGKRLHSNWMGLLAATLCTVTVLHIQLSHFYAVDTVLTFFVMLTLYRALALVDGVPEMRAAPGMGLAMGMALATKVSAAPLALPIVLAWWASVKRARLLPEYPTGHTLTRWWRMWLGSILTGLIALVTFVVFEPYAVIDVFQFLSDIVTEGYMAQGLSDVPYTRQFIGTWPYVYPVVQTVLWTLGPALGVLGWLSLPTGIWAAAVALAKRQWADAGKIVVPLSWALAYFAIVGRFHAKFLRYMLPIAPVLCLGAAWLLVTLVSRRRWSRVAGIALLSITLAVTGVYAGAYMHIYAQPHTWVQATEWLCRELPIPSKIMIEHWDDPLPLIQGTNNLRCYAKHYMFTFPAYNPDTQAKVNALCETLEMSDYVILASNRLYNTIPRLPERYPATSRYYRLLMSGALGFEPEYVATSYPQIGDWRLVDDTFTNPELPIPQQIEDERSAHHNIMPGRADESYSVYDHPMPIVMHKAREMTYDELYALFADLLDDLPER